MANADSDQLSRLSHALNTLRTSQLDLNGEPPFHYLTDPPGKILLQAYREHLTPQANKAFFYAEIPPTEQRPTGAAWLLKVLLQALGDPDWNKREAAYTHAMRNEPATFLHVARVTCREGCRHEGAGKCPTMWLMPRFGEAVD
ncbi:hypothetical protein [Ktedonobacter racemifer]|uniref:Uncharacterized protein n=1 Tax=Ktedonobacter racemifer DSM 44963 TaxID=485913 RepID=D6TUB0_KTERA|nr:hypothetical protein [Ktedonobacter racemifer]EFH85207.1 hypothetical protein Krac_6382 [Ktedonobacter racemifer DSM 44963]